MAATAQINIKIDPKLKKSAQRFAKKLGISLSTLIKMSVHQTISNQELTLDAKPKIPTPRLEASIRAAHNEIQNGHKDLTVLKSAEDVDNYFDSLV